MPSSTILVSITAFLILTTLLFIDESSCQKQKKKVYCDAVAEPDTSTVTNTTNQTAAPLKPNTNNPSLFSGFAKQHQGTFRGIGPAVQSSAVDDSVPQKRGWGTMTNQGRYDVPNLVDDSVFYRLLVNDCSFCEVSPNFFIGERFANNSCTCYCCIPLVPEAEIPCRHCAHILPRIVHRAKCGHELCACYSWDNEWRPKNDPEWSKQCGPFDLSIGTRPAQAELESMCSRYDAKSRKDYCSIANAGNEKCKQIRAEEQQTARAKQQQQPGGGYFLPQPLPPSSASTVPLFDETFVLNRNAKRV